MRTRRARQHQMLKREREKLTRMVKEYVLAQGGRVTEEGQRLMWSTVSKCETPDYLELPTKAGPLSIIPYGNWLACRFQDVKAAVDLLRDDPAGSHLNPYSGKFNFHFGRCTADEALEEFTSEVSRILPVDELKDAKTFIALLQAVYNVVVSSVESFERLDGVGADLAYLLGALLNNTACEWPEDRTILTILRRHFPAGHTVYSYIHVESE